MNKILSRDSPLTLFAEHKIAPLSGKFESHQPERFTRLGAVPGHWKALLFRPGPGVGRLPHSYIEGRKLWVTYRALLGSNYAWRGHCTLFGAAATEKRSKHFEKGRIILLSDALQLLGFFVGEFKAVAWRVNSWLDTGNNSILIFFILLLNFMIRLF